jgi:LysR family transcriptional regulator, hydrogen peroxide-inducible genes activator
MEIAQLRYTVAVAETGNFTRAAERTNVTQPSLSQQIINLEHEVGHKLFHRLGRKAVLTEAGTVFLERAKRILFEVENASKELSDHPALGRRITVGAIQTFAPYALPKLIATCRERHPNLEIFVREDFRSQLLRGVLEGDLDLAIVSQPVKDHRLSVEPLLTEPLLLAVGKEHPLAKRGHVKIADLAAETFVMLGNASSLTEKVQAYFGDMRVAPRIGFRCAQIPTVKALVALGLGVTIFPRAVRSPEDKKTLVYLEIADGSPQRELVVARHLQRYQSRGAEQFLALLREQVAELAPAPPSRPESPPFVVTHA